MKDTVSTQDGQKRSKKLLSKQLVIPVFAVVFILSVAGSFILGYARGHQAGQDASSNAFKKSINDLINPVNALSNNPLFPSAFIGKFNSLSGSTLTMKHANGTTSSVIVNSDTKVTKSSNPIKLEEITSNSNITVFTKKQDANSSNKDTPVATRIIVR